MSAPIYSIPDVVQRKQPDPCMYLCVHGGDDKTKWYVINSTTPNLEYLRPCLPPLPKRLLDFGCAAVGPVIYVAGGEDMDSPFSSAAYIRIHTRDPNSSSVRKDVYYIDTRDPTTSGWKKGCPMKEPRRQPYLVTVDRKLYAFGGMWRDASSFAEVFDTESKSCWNALQNPSSRVAADPLSFPGTVRGSHVVSNKNNNMMMNSSMILFHDEMSPSLIRYNIELDSWDTFSESSLGIGKNTSALVDGILYCLDWRMPGKMYGLDISDPENELQPVLLVFESFDRDMLRFDPFLKRYIKPQPLPQPGFDDSYDGPPGFLVSLGGSKLAVLWGGHTGVPDNDTFVVSYSVLDMSKRLNSTTGRVDFVANTLSSSYYYMSGYLLMSCLPVFPSEKQSETKGISKGGGMTSGNEKQSDTKGISKGGGMTLGSSSKSNFYKKKKGSNKNTKKP